MKFAYRVSTILIANVSYYMRHSELRSKMIESNIHASCQESSPSWRHLGVFIISFLFVLQFG